MINGTIMRKCMNEQQKERSNLRYLKIQHSALAIYKTCLDYR